MYVKIPISKITKMAIVKTDCKKNLKQLVAEQKCNYAINGGLYDMKTGKVNPIPLRIDGKTIATSKFGYWMMAWNTGKDICMIHSSQMDKWKYAIACSSFLKDGVNTTYIYTSAQGGCRGRTGFGNDDFNVHLCVTTDSNGAMTPIKLRDTMKANGCKNGLLLDAGGSSQIYANGTYLYTGRPVAYWICIWTDEVAKHTTQNVEEDVPYDSPTRTLKVGCKGEDVQWLQWKLNKVGFNCGSVDGDFGAGTKSAVMKFQKANGLIADGIVGANTKAKLS